MLLRDVMCVYRVVPLTLIVFAMRASWLFLAVWLTISLSIVQCSDLKK